MDTNNRKLAAIALAAALLVLLFGGLFPLAAWIPGLMVVDAIACCCVFVFIGVMILLYFLDARKIEEQAVSHNLTALGDKTVDGSVPPMERTAIPAAGAAAH